MKPKQRPEVGRSGHTDLNPDHTAEVLDGRDPPSSSGETGPVPADNQPGHRPETDQDRPDPDAMADRLGVEPDRED